MTILGLNFKNQVLSKLNDNELPLNQSFILSIIMLISSLNFGGLGFVITMLVSSANRIGFDGSAVMFGRSFIKNTKNKGPSIEP
jgi:hypothetical protein